MSNTIQIRHGLNAPGAGVLAPYELGYRNDTQEIIIGSDPFDNEMDPSVGFITPKVSFAHEAQHAADANFAGQADNANSLGGIPSNKYALKDNYATKEELTNIENPFVVRSAQYAYKSETAANAEIATEAKNASNAKNAETATKATFADNLFSPGWCQIRGVGTSSFNVEKNESYYANINFDMNFAHNRDKSTTKYFSTYRGNIDGKFITVLKVEKNGTAIVSGSIYMNECTPNKARGVYIYRKKPSETNYEELHSVQYICAGAGAICTGPVIVQFTQGDLLYFAGKATDNIGYCSGNNAATHLDVIFLPEVITNGETS